MKKVFLFGIVLYLLLPLSVYAVPVLQVGAPDGLGGYADYLNLTDPTEKDTALTSGTTILVAGVYQNNNVLNLGGQFGGGSDWGAVDSDFNTFNSHGAVLLAAVPDGTISTALGSLTVDGNTAFFSSDILSGLFPNNHDPLKDLIADFLFFDIGDFANNPSLVPDFADDTGAAAGEIKRLMLAGTTGLDWIHFDVLALESSTQGRTSFKTTIENNPGSHDLTWKDDNGGGGGGDPVPEPGTLALLGCGLLGMAGVARKKRSQ